MTWDVWIYRSPESAQSCVNHTCVARVQLACGASPVVNSNSNILSTLGRRYSFQTSSDKPNVQTTNAKSGNLSSDITIE